ncbi:MAG: hypothetical protein SFW62_05265 [Alphaproteobacteria bacterium]|nr:hypothetical protein [Alphaproteobacteria bacterium]
MLSHHNKSFAQTPAGVAAMIGVMNELSQIMGEEEGLVNTRNQEQHAALLKRKQRLTMNYRSGMKSLAAQPEIVKSLPSDARAALKAAAQKLSDVTEANAHMLRIAVTATQRLIQDIVSIVKQEALTPTAYTNPNTAHLELGGYSPTCKPIAVSRTV